MILRSYAKINLSLDIIGVREGGYHEVRTVMQKTSLYDVLDISFSPSDEEGVQIEISTNRPYLPTDERNLCYRAVRIMEKRAEEKGKTFSGRVRIDIEKRIPVAAGLAGGSGNAAAVFIALNRLWKLNMNTRELCETGKELGADVAFMVLVQNSGYRCALGEGLGEELTPLRSGFRKHLVLAKPPFGVSTKEVYRGIDDCEITERPDTDELIRGIKERDYETIYTNMVNVLECYTLEAYGEVKKLKGIIEETEGVEKVLMSGSGPTVFGVYEEMETAKTACMYLRSLGYEAYWTDTFKDAVKRA